ncbi:acyl-CoA dehydrogenase family protein [Micromonospora carbonacea]|uniref:Acyl-CoA dehydrogenase n=1 Tax=Micromonospora carbonacea TaxID=47853 RepID=A0A1C4YKC9_9ACTN|nr:acyl-CoA dehydrogenase family protein [Micromonospora carbonacea]SCF21120.1 Acyl-CoA dehydrogenase [Micromonospora carbonacea]
MTELEPRLRRLQAQAREWAAEMRPYALEVDRDPDAVTRVAHLPALARVAALQIPPEFNPEPLVLGDQTYYLMSASERVVFFEEGACADLGMMLGSPGGPMSGVVVDALGSQEQKEWFYGRLLLRPTWTFFALSEPEHGSDAANMATRLTPPADPDGPARLNGVKRYVGNAGRAEFGVVFARTGPGPLGFAAVLVDASAPGFATTPVRTIGVRGAGLGEITLDDVELTPDRVLGAHLRPSRRGMAAWLRTFNLLRPAVAVMGVGVARAAYEYVLAERSSLRVAERLRLERMERAIATTRRMLRAAAAAVDHDPSAGHLASAAKATSARLAERVTLAALDFFGPGARLEHPLLDKLVRDAGSVEYMEGTSNIQRLGVFGGLLRGAFPPLQAARLPTES